MIAVSVNEDGSLNTCTCRWNHSNGGNDNIMTTQQISQLLGVNFYQTFLPVTEEEKNEYIASLPSSTKYEIGSLFSHCDKDSIDLLWPNHQMCNILEQLGYDELARGFVNGYVNSRGCRWINEKTYQSDEQKALLFEELSQKWCIRYPFVCENIFNRLATEFHRSADSCRSMSERYKF